MKKRIIISYLVLILLLILSGAMCIYIGSVKVNIADFFIEDSIGRSIILDIRFPRMLAAVLAGGALSVAGYCLQTFFHNPVAGPYLLGISSGAKLMVACVLIVFSSSVGVISNLFMIFASFAGAMIAMGFVLIFSKHVSSMSMLLVCGVMIGYICTAICDLLVTFADDADIINLHNWSRGSISGISGSKVLIMAVVIIAATIFVFAMSKQMAAFLVSESYARSVGVNIKSFKVLLIVFSSLLAATVTAFAGPISFVGIAVPHIVRKVLKTEIPLFIIPACFIGGSVFTCICDLISRTIFAPTELSISTVTAIFGSPIVIFILIKRRGR